MSVQTQEYSLRTMGHSMDNKVHVLNIQGVIVITCSRVL